MSDGSLIRATRTENRDLFDALPWSHGSLGFLVALELKVIKVKPFVRMTYTPIKGQKDYCNAVRKASGALSKDSEVADYVEMTIFSKDEAVLMEGTFCDGDPKLQVILTKLNLQKANQLFFKTSKIIILGRLIIAPSGTSRGSLSTRDSS